MTTPQFTPDGRLLQVEYASRAATHSSPCVVCKFGAHETLVMTRKSSRKLQNRLIQLSETTAVCLSGVVSDSLALLAKVYELQDNNRRLYGSKTLTERQVASAITTACQRHSFGGGLRPYGSTIVIVSPTAILQSDPSGAVVALDDKWNIVGSSNTELRRKLESENVPTTLAEALLTVAKHLVPDNEDDDAWLEVVVLSKDMGVHKLSDDQVGRLLLKIKNQ